MLQIAANLSTFALGAGEPFLLEVEFLTPTGTRLDISSRAYVLSFYAANRAIVEQLDGELVTDDLGKFLRFVQDGTFSENLYGKPGISIELAERYRNGRNIIATGALKVTASAATVPSYDNGAIGESATRIVIKASQTPGAAPTLSTHVVPYVDQVAPEISLTALALSTTALTSGTAVTIAITGATDGSTITGTPPDGMALDSAGRGISGTPTIAGDYSLVLTETLAGSVNSPRQTTIGVAVAATPVVPSLTGYYPNGRTNSKLTAGLLRPKQGTGRMKWLMKGDSTTVGEPGTGSMDGAAQHRPATYIAAALAAKSIAAIDTGQYGDGRNLANGNVALSTYNHNITDMGGWYVDNDASSKNFAGGSYLHTQGNAFHYSPPGAWDSAEWLIYNPATNATLYFGIGAGAPDQMTFTGDYASAATNHISPKMYGAGGVGFLTATGKMNAPAANLDWLAVGDSMPLAGVRVWNSQVPAVDMLVHAGRGAWAVDGAATDAGTMFYALEAQKHEAADFTTILYGLNEAYNGNASLTDYTNAIGAMIDAALLTGDVLLLFSPPPGGPFGNASFAALHGAAKQLAATKGVPFFSFYEYYNSAFTPALAAKYGDGQAHPLPAFYAELYGDVLVGKVLPLMAPASFA